MQIAENAYTQKFVRPSGQFVLRQTDLPNFLNVSSVLKP